MSEETIYEKNAGAKPEKNENKKKAETTGDTKKKPQEQLKKDGNGKKVAATAAATATVAATAAAATAATEKPRADEAEHGDDAAQHTSPAVEEQTPSDADNQNTATAYETESTTNPGRGDEQMVEPTEPVVDSLGNVEEPMPLGTVEDPTVPVEGPIGIDEDLLAPVEVPIGDPIGIGSVEGHIEPDGDPLASLIGEHVEVPITEGVDIIEPVIPDIYTYDPNNPDTYNPDYPDDDTEPLAPLDSPIEEPLASNDIDSGFGAPIDDNMDMGGVLE